MTTVLETVVLPIKLSTYGVIGNRTQTIRVKVWCSAIELLPNKAADRSRTGNLLIRNQLLYPIELWQQIVNAVFMWFTTRDAMSVNSSSFPRTAKTWKTPHEGIEPPSRLPTECLASISNTIMGIRHTGWMNRHSITPLTQKNTSHIQSNKGD